MVWGTIRVAGGENRFQGSQAPRPFVGHRGRGACWHARCLLLTEDFSCSSAACAAKSRGRVRQRTLLRRWRGGTRSQFGQLVRRFHDGAAA